MLLFRYVVAFAHRPYRRLVFIELIFFLNHHWTQYFFFLSIKWNILEFLSCSSISFKSSLWTEFRLDWYSKMHPWCFATGKFSWKKLKEKKIFGKCHKKTPRKTESSTQIVAHCYLLQNNCLNLLHRCSSTVSDIFFVILCLTLSHYFDSINSNKNINARCVKYTCYLCDHFMCLSNKKP